MNTVSPRKSRALSQFEGMALTAVFQAFPTFTAAALLVKLSCLSSMTSHAESVVTFIVLAVLFQTIAVTSLGSRFPRFFKQAYEPLFYDTTLSLGDSSGDVRMRSGTRSPRAASARSAVSARTRSACSRPLTMAFNWFA